MTTYQEFIERKSQRGENLGFAPLWMPAFLFDFQLELVEWAIRKGRAAIFADCGLGKTPMQLVWAENIVRKTNGRVLILTPLAVAQQTAQEGAKFGIEVKRSRDGAIDGSGIYITNYEQLHKFNSEDFVAVVCDESSILKHFSGATQKAVTRFMSKLEYRLLCTATAAPNDYTELGTASEALGALGYSDMLSRFFKMEDKKRTQMNDVKLARAIHTGDYYQKLSYRVAQQIGQWRLKGHAETPFWQWVCSWARACRKPSDIGGCQDGGFVLPPLTENEHIIDPQSPRQDMLFNLPAVGLREEREERKRTLHERCEYVAALVANSRSAVVWCHMNTEGDLLAKLIPGAVQVAGANSDDEKEAAYAGFSNGSIRVLVTKPKIGAWGLNWQHCNHVVTFASHSYEQYYQSVRRCWRFGQTKEVTVDVVATEGERYVKENMARKSKAADKMFAELVRHMNDAMHIARTEFSTKVDHPAWLSTIS